MAGSGTISDRYGSRKVTADGREYIVHANAWGSSSGSMTMTYNGTSFRIETQTEVSNSYAPLAFPGAFIGSNIAGVTQGSNLPKQVSNLASVPTTWTWSKAGTTGAHNAIYELWFTSSSRDSVSNPDKRLAVWLYRHPSTMPPGRTMSSNMRLNGLPGFWDIWAENSQVTYVATLPQYSVSFDLNEVIKDAVNRNFLSGSLYLQTIFAGFEILSGGAGLESKDFTVVVK